MRFPAVPSWQTSARYLKIVASHLKEISSSKISIFPRSSRQNDAIDELNSAMIASAIKFAAGVSMWGTTFVDESFEPAYEQLFQRDIERPSQSYFNQLLLATEAVCFFLHSLNRLLGRSDSKDFKRAIYNSLLQTLICWLMQVAVSALGRETASISEEAFDALIKRRDLEYARSACLLGDDSNDTDSALSMAARTISEEVSVKDSFDREGHSDHVILTQIVSTVLMLEFEALDLTARIERISLARATQELGACFAPLTDRPQQLIDLANSGVFSVQLNTEGATTAANRIPVPIMEDSFLRI